MKIKFLWLSLSAASVMWSAGAAAQTASSIPQVSSGEPLTEVVVTAERRHTDLQTTPISATVITGGDLANMGVTTIDALQFASPGAVINNFGQGNDFNIRGVGKAEHNSQTTVGVVTYRDGVATFPGYFQGEPYYDIATVEILRGPQGTFGGQNATGGAVIVNTNDPIIGGGVNGYVQVQAGNYTDFGLQGAVNLPISNTLAARFAFNSESADSFYHVTGPNGGSYTGNPGKLREASGRFSLLWKPDEALSVLLKTDFNYLNFGAYSASPYNSTEDLFNIGVNSPQEALDRFAPDGTQDRLCAAGWHHAAVGHGLSERRHSVSSRFGRHECRERLLRRQCLGNTLVRGVQCHLARHGFFYLDLRCLCGRRQLEFRA